MKLLQTLRNLTRPFFPTTYPVTLKACEVQGIIMAVDTAVAKRMLMEVPEIHLKTARKAIESRWPGGVVERHCPCKEMQYEFTERELYALRAGLTAYQAHCADSLETVTPWLHSVILMNADHARKLAKLLQLPPPEKS